MHKSERATAVAIARRSRSIPRKRNLEPLAERWAAAAAGLTKSLRARSKKKRTPCVRSISIQYFRGNKPSRQAVWDCCDLFASVSHARHDFFVRLKSVRNCSVPGIILLGRLPPMCYINQKSVTHAPSGGAKPWVDFLASDTTTTTAAAATSFASAPQSRLFLSGRETEMRPCRLCT